MEISSLQKARYEYAPKLPQMLRGGISEISVLEGAETKSVADCEKIHHAYQKRRSLRHAGRAWYREHRVAKAHRGKQNNQLYSSYGKLRRK